MAILTSFNNSWRSQLGDPLVYSFSFIGVETESDSSEMTCPRPTSSGRFSAPFTPLSFFFVLPQHLLHTAAGPYILVCIHVSVTHPTVGSLRKETTSEDMYLPQYEDPIFLQERSVSCGYVGGLQNAQNNAVLIWRIAWRSGLGSCLGREWYITLRG